MHLFPQHIDSLSKKIGEDMREWHYGLTYLENKKVDGALKRLKKRAKLLRELAIRHRDAIPLIVGHLNSLNEATLESLGIQDTAAISSTLDTGIKGLLTYLDAMFGEILKTLEMHTSGRSREPTPYNNRPLYNDIEGRVNDAFKGVAAFKKLVGKDIAALYRDARALDKKTAGKAGKPVIEAMAGILRIEEELKKLK